MPGRPNRRGDVGAAANRDGSRSDAEIAAAVFTVLLAGRVDSLSPLAGLAGSGFHYPSRINHYTSKRGQINAGA